VKQIYLDTNQLGPYNISNNLAFRILNETEHSVYVVKKSEWLNADTWPSVLKKDFDGRIKWGTRLAQKNDFVINYKCRVPYRLRTTDKGLNLNSDYLKLASEVPCSEKRVRELKERMLGKNKVVVMGSVWNHEMDLLQFFVEELIHKEYDVLIAPRHLDSIESFKKKITDINLEYGLRSEGETFQHKNIIFLDTLGELKEFYSLGSINLVCGGLEPNAYRGGHNPLESLVFAKPTLIGKDYSNHTISIKYFRNSPFLEILESNGLHSLENSFEKLEQFTKREDFREKQEEFEEKLRKSSKESEVLIDDVLKILN